MILEHPLVSRTLATGSPAPRWQPRFWDADAAYEQRREAILFSREQKDPCEGCWRQQVCQEGCELWRSRYLQRQKGIVAYGEKLRRDRPPQRQDVFAYSHPDLVRRYEKTHPCAGCLLEKGCQDPCARYLHWYDLRMALARHRADRIQAGVLRSMDEKSIVIDLERGRADITGSFNVSGENEKGYLIGSLRPGSLELVQTDGQGRLLLQLALTEQGVTLSGGGRQLALTLSPEGGRLTGLADPAAEDEAVSKGYLQGYVFAQLDALRAELGLPVG